MSNNVVHLPRPQSARPPATGLALYIRVGRDQHKEMLDLLVEGETDFFGIVIEAQNADRHRELIQAASEKQLDVILDPKTQAMATLGGHTPSLAGLPWGLDRPHRLDDFRGSYGRAVAEQIADYVVMHGFSQVIGPSHLLQNPNDPWLRYDIANMGHLRDALRARGSNATLIYSLALPIRVLRDAAERQAIAAAVADAPFDALWLKVDNFGADATGEKTVAYIKACADFETLGIPVIADYVGGLSGLALLAFGAVGGIAHGITQYESFKSSTWRRVPEKKGGGAPGGRVYFSRLDLELTRKEAEAFLGTSRRIQGRYGCRDTHCCPRGQADMLDRPSRHFVHQRSREVAALSRAPTSVRVAEYMDNHVRRVSDDVAALTSVKNLDEAVAKKIEKKQKGMSRFRQAMAHLAKTRPATDQDVLPKTRSDREQERK